MTRKITILQPSSLTSLIIVTFPDFEKIKMAFMEMQV